MKFKRIIFILLIISTLLVGLNPISAELWYNGDLADDDPYADIEIEPDKPSEGIMSFVDNLYLIIDIVEAIIFLAFIAIALSVTSNEWNIEQFIILGLSLLIFSLSTHKLLLLFIGLLVMFASLIISGKEK